MARGANQRLKLLYLWKILLEKSSERHPITLQKILYELADSDIEAERKSLYHDMRDLRAFGLDIRMVRKNRQTWYYVGERTFAVSELKLLIDSVLTSRDLTERKSEELIRKLSTLFGAYEEELSRRKVYVPDRIRSMSESLCGRIDRIHEAIAADVRLRFGYVSYTVDKKRALRRDGQTYVVSPYAVVWDDAHYYLLAYDADADILKHFRVDKMENLAPDSCPREGADRFGALDMAAYVKKSFHMFGGEERAVTMRFSDRLVGVVLDRFGEDVVITPEEDGHFSVTVQVAVSPQFFGWLCGLDGEAVITAPKSVGDAMRRQLMKVAAAQTR